MTLPDNSEQNAIAPILTVTLNPAIDQTVIIENLSSNEFIRPLEFRRCAGGKGINVARVLSELDQPATAFCVIGGPDAYVYRELLEYEPIETACCEISATTRTNITFIIRQTHRRTKINQAGDVLSDADWWKIEADFEALLHGRQWVVFSGSLPPQSDPDRYVRLIRLAHKYQIKTLLDFSGKPLLMALKERPEIIKINTDELHFALSAIKGHTKSKPLRTAEQVIRAAKRLQQLGGQSIVVTSGSADCTLLEENGDITILVPPAVDSEGIPQLPPEQRSPMGSGDSLTAGLITGVVRQMSLESSLQLGIACGTACAASPDGILATRSLIHAFLPLVHPNSSHARKWHKRLKEDPLKDH